MKGKKFLLIPCKPNLHNSNSCPSIFKTNKNNTMSIINSKVEETKYGKNMSFIELTKNNKIFILTLIDEDKLQISGTSGQSIYDLFNQENIEHNELAAQISSLIEKGAFENRCSDQENQSNPKYINIVYTSKNNDAINNQLSCNNNKREEYIKELEKKIETLLNINKELTEEVENLKKYKDKINRIKKIMNTSNDFSNKEEELKNENQILAEAKLLEKNKKELNDDFQRNENEIKEQNNYEIKKLIKIMRTEFELGDNDYNDKKLAEALKESDLDKELAFSKLFEN